MSAPLLPSKHVRLGECVLGIGAQVLQKLARPRSVDSLIRSINSDRAKKELPITNDDRMMLVVAFLYSIDAISADEDGRLCKHAAD